MFIRKITAKNYRTLEDFSLNFENYYTALSGKNNAGKSNVLRAIRTIIDSGLHFRIRGNSIMGISGFNWKDEVTSWKAESKEDIIISATFEVGKETDTEIYKYITDFIVKDCENLESIGDIAKIDISYIKKPAKDEEYSLRINGIEISDDYKKKELLKRIQAAECISFHNSTQSMFGPFDDSVDKVADFISPSDSEDINKKKEDLLKIVRRSLRNHQQELTGWLGKLEEKYEVSLSVQGLNFEREPIDISLKEKGGDVILDNWGSGTKNRTLIFLKLLNAAKRSRNKSETDRITPIIILEEPESFLHPQAQAEFGRVLQDISSELKIQIITTTHSPYFLSFLSPHDNILLERSKNKTNPNTVIVPTDNDSWVKPFVEALGINQENYGPMKDVVFSENSNILLVEGLGDKGYLEFLQSEYHGKNALLKNMEIFPVNGVDAFKNTVWISFLKKKFKKVGIMIDLDRSKEIKKGLEAIGYKDNQDLFIVGTELSPFIEGYVPESIISTVSAENPTITRKLMNANAETRKSGRNELKNKLLEKIVANHTVEDMDAFYGLVKKINKMYKS